MSTPTPTPTPTVTPTITMTNTPTGTATSTPTNTPTNTPTPSNTPGFTGFSANQQYAYTIEILGNFSGGSISEGGPADGVAPHPVYINNEGIAVQQLNSIRIGGFDGLNN